VRLMLISLYNTKSYAKELSNNGCSKLQ
jgi:hypothetical protein